MVLIRSISTILGSSTLKTAILFNTGRHVSILLVHLQAPNVLLELTKLNRKLLHIKFVVQIRPLFIILYFPFCCYFLFVRTRRSSQLLYIKYTIGKASLKITISVTTKQEQFCVLRTCQTWCISGPRMSSVACETISSLPPQLQAKSQEV